MSALVSVVIPSYNSAKFIAATLESVFSQTHRNLEILVVDDGSIDNTIDVLQAFRERILIIQKPNGGPASARNLGIRQAKGEYVAFLDADDLWVNNKIERQLAAISAEPKIGMVYSRRKFLQDEKVISEIPKKPCLSGMIFRELFNGNFITTSTVLARKACFDRLGVFDERKDFIAVEDYDMWLRIAKEYALACIDEELVYYRVHAGGISKKIDRSYLNEKAVIETALKRWPNLEQETAVSINKRLAKLYVNYGSDFLESMETRSARDKFLTVLKYDLLNGAGWIGLAKSSLPSGIFGGLRRIKRSSSKV